MISYDVVVIGAGAAGLFAAIRAKELGNTVLIIEKNNVAGKKLLITGKGRCNLSNKSSKTNYLNNIFPNPKFLYSAFNNFFVDDTIRFFEKNNVPIKLERGNRLFPKSDKSYDIVNCLVNYCKKENIDIFYNSVISEIITKNNAVDSCIIKKENSEITIQCSNIILCTGGFTYPKTGSTGDGYEIAKKLGHKIITPKPSLVGLIPKSDIFADIKVTSIYLKNINASLCINEKITKNFFGDVEIFENIISGPSILPLSRSAVESLLKKDKVEIIIDFKPALTYEKLNERLLRDFNENSKTKISELLKLLLAKDMIPIFSKKISTDKNKLANQITSKERQEIISLLKEFRIEISKDEGINRAVITNGGISTNEINPKTMESKIISNLFFAGEIIDIDANTGGYNLQIAFSTGWTAGNSIQKNKNCDAK